MMNSQKENKQMQISTPQKAELTERQKGQEALKALANSLRGISVDELDKLSGKDEIKLVRIQRGVNISEVLTYKPMCGYQDKELLFKIILAAVIWFVEGFKEGARMRNSDLYKFALKLQDYSAESFEDILLCFKMAENGDLTDPVTRKRIERYSSMSVEILDRYWASFLDLKYSIKENQIRDIKNKETGGDFRTEEDTLIIKLEKQQQFVKDYKNATRQIDRWDNEQNTHSVKSLITTKYLE